MLLNEQEQLSRKIAELEAENARLKRDLHHSADLFNKIFHASSNVMAIHTIKEGRYVDLNEACAKLGGYSREELIGRIMESDLLPDPELEETVSRKLREEGKVSNILANVRTRNGEIRTILFSADPITVNNEPCLLAVSVDITDREKEASALRRSEEKYRMLVENSLQGLTIIQDSRLVFCNNTFAAMLGYSVEELLELSREQLEGMLHPDDRGAMQNRMQDQLAGKPVNSRFEYRGFKCDGSLIWVEAYASVIDYNGKPAIQSVYMDVTERKKAENALRESEERFRLIAETIDEIFWIFDAGDNAAIYLSPAFERIWGCPREQVLNNPDPHMMDMIFPDDRKQVLANYELLGSGQPISYEYRIIRPDGTIRNIWDRAYPITDNDGKRKRIVGVGQDVTESRRVQEALKESKEYLNQIINCIGDPIFVKNREHKITLVNDALCAFAGMKREELVGTIGLPPMMEKALWENEEAVFETGQEIQNEDVFEAMQDGPRTMMTKKSLLTDKSGNKQIIGVLRDITEYKRLEAQFLQSQKMEAIGALAGGVAHDFNNLMNVINGYTEIMMEDIAPEDPLRKDVEKIWDAGQRAAILTSKLLDFGRKQILQPEIFDLNQVITDMNSLLRRMIGEDIEISFNARAMPAFINADPGKIQQVIMNLVVNARDAMPDGGKITIETANIAFEEGYINSDGIAKTGLHVMLGISDTGIGMDAQIQTRMFEPFFTTKRKGKGTGLGLSTVYGIVKQSDGFLWVNSEPGKGTTIKVYFPQSTGEHLPLVPAEDMAETEFLGAETLLLVEDEPDVRELARRILRMRGYNMLEASDGIEALRVSRDYADEIHLVLTDVVMPGMGGKALVARIEELRPGIKALYMSGYTDNAISHQGILDSNIAFIQKPFTIDSLARKVREVLDS